MRYVVKKYHWIQLPNNIDDIATFEWRGHENGGGELIFNIGFHKYIEMDKYVWADDQNTKIFFEIETILNQNLNQTMGNRVECTTK